LFERVDRTAAKGVAQAYAAAAQDATASGLPLPERMTSGGWRGELRDAFPFHPDTVLLLDKRLATVPGFQRTRGALRYGRRGRTPRGVAVFPPGMWSRDDARLRLSTAGGVAAGGKPIGAQTGV
jgi:hypothetical protein